MARSDWRRPEVEPVAEGWRRIKLSVSYDGSKYHGWQSQNNAESVQSRLESVLREVTGEPELFVQGSGRTDRGVHALDQVCHFDTQSTISADKFMVILNTKLEKSIRVTSSSEPEGIFHARFTTYSREYWYLVKRMSDMLPFDENRYCFVRELPDLDILNSYAKSLFGTHDFTTFASARDESLSKYRDIYVSEWNREVDAYGYEVLKYRVAGNAFLYHQVRSMVGTMLEGARSGLTAEGFKEKLDKKDRSEALKTAPSEGLYLARISYDEEEYRWFEEEYNGE